MLNGNTLVEALREEDRLLRHLVTHLPPAAREFHGPDGALSCKETLGHLSFWDDLTVQFFRSMLAVDACSLPPPMEVEARSGEALEHVRRLPFGEALARYLESTGALLEFLEASWTRLSERQRHDFWVTLKHRRHHRLCLEQALEVGRNEGLADGRNRLTAEA